MSARTERARVPIRVHGKTIVVRITRGLWEIRWGVTNENCIGRCEAAGQARQHLRALWCRCFSYTSKPERFSSLHRSASPAWDARPATRKQPGLARPATNKRPSLPITHARVHAEAHAVHNHKDVPSSSPGFATNRALRTLFVERGPAQALYTPPRGVLARLV
jgi:hypothetical protein